jgi:hypothetical protein
METYSITENNHYIIIELIEYGGGFEKKNAGGRVVFLDKDTLQIKRSWVKTTLSASYLNVQYNSKGYPSQIHSFQKWYDCPLFNLNVDGPDKVTTQKFGYDVNGRFKSFEDERGNWWDAEIMVGEIPYTLKYNEVINTYCRLLNNTQPNLKLSSNNKSWDVPNPCLVINNLSMDLNQFRSIIIENYRSLLNIRDIHTKRVPLGDINSSLLIREGLLNEHLINEK